MIWSFRPACRFDLAQRGLVMGILNITPDSFSDGGVFLDPARAVAHGVDMIGAGASMIDVGGQSTRPGAEDVPLEEEMRRVLPVVRGLREACPDCLISIDTMKAEVARAALAEGAVVVNDVSGLTADPDMVAVARETGCGVVVMHMRGVPATMQKDPRYGDVVAEVGCWLKDRSVELVRAGISREAMVFDPGIGFGKTRRHNLELLASLDDLAPPGRPLLLGVSRKSVIGGTLGARDLPLLDHATVALTAQARLKGVGVFRVHEVEMNVRALRMAEAITPQRR